MTHSLSRRRLLSLSTVGGATLLGACTVIHAGGTGTATLDVERIVVDSKAILSAVSAALLIASLVTALGPNYAIAQAALLAAQGTLSEIEALTGGSVTVILDKTKLQTLVVSLLSDLQTALTLMQAAVVTMTGSVVTTIATYISAALSLIPIVQIAAGLVTARPRSGLMSESQALAVAAAAAR